MRKDALAVVLATLGIGGAALAQPEVELGGLVEIEANRGEESSDIAVATAELGLSAQINEKVSSELVLLHEADEPDPIVVDIATVSVVIRENVSITAGRSYAPFGLYESSMISDPLTLELAETGATLLQADIASGPLTTSLYTFNGTNASNDKIDNWGINLGYEAEKIAVALGYLGNMGDTDGIAAETLDNDVAGMSISAVLSLGNLTLIGEHITALDEFQPGDGNADYTLTETAQPSASNVEIAYTIGANTFAAGLQLTDEAEILELPETRTLIAISHALMENTTLALEYARGKDYTGEKSDLVTAQIAVEF